MKSDSPHVRAMRQISGALKETISAHGPITKEFIGSASKRILKNLVNQKFQDAIQELVDERVQNPPRKKTLEEKYEKIRKDHAELVRRAKEAGIIE